jgi:hypothetical protein
MGLNYAISAYLEQQRLADFFDWLYEHSEYNNTFSVVIGDRQSKIRGAWLNVDEQKLQAEETLIIPAFDSMTFSTSLVFDIDPETITSLEDWGGRFGDVKYYLEDFRERFEDSYLGDGKISIGHFDVSIYRLHEHGVYDISLTAVTSSMSRMLQESLSVRKWLAEFSEGVRPVMTYLDMESEGNRVHYYRGKTMDRTLTDWEEDFYKEAPPLLDALENEENE